MTKNMSGPIVWVLMSAWFASGLGGCRSDPAAQTCSQPLSKSTCAATFDAQVSQPRFCGTQPCCALAGDCGRYKVWRSPPSLSSQTCVYDSTGQVLLAGLDCSDYPAFCDSSAFCIQAGAAISADMECDIPKLPTHCGADGGAGD